MKIIDARMKYVPINKLKVGDVFLYNAISYMKISNQQYNAVDLVNGELKTFGSTIYVLPVNAVLTITDKEGEHDEQNRENEE